MGKCERTAPPVAGFSASPTSGVMPLIVTFTDTSSGSPTSWNWSFGDGSYASTRNPTHTFANNGVYTISLNATNAGGSNISVKTNYIVVNIPSPVANFSANVTSGNRAADGEFCRSVDEQPDFLGLVVR